MAMWFSSASSDLVIRHTSKQKRIRLCYGVNTNTNTNGFCNWTNYEIITVGMSPSCSLFFKVVSSSCESENLDLLHPSVDFSPFNAGFLFKWVVRWLAGCWLLCSVPFILCTCLERLCIGIMYPLKIFTNCSLFKCSKSTAGSRFKSEKRTLSELIISIAVRRVTSIPCN